jgi:hypothetical protein
VGGWSEGVENTGKLKKVVKILFPEDEDCVECVLGDPIPDDVLLASC